MNRIFRFAVLTALSSLALVGCQDDPVVDTTVEVESVSLSASALEMQAGETLALSSRVSPDNATVSTVAWISTDESVASVDAVSGASITVTAVAKGSATIKAIALSGGRTATCRVTVTGGSDEPEDHGDQNSSESGDIEDFK